MGGVRRGRKPLRVVDSNLPVQLRGQEKGDPGVCSRPLVYSKHGCLVHEAKSWVWGLLLADQGKIPYVSKTQYE
jgi:hypothetical protein